MSYKNWENLKRKVTSEEFTLTEGDICGRHTEGEQILKDVLQTCSRGERWGDRNHEDLLRFNEEWGR